MSIGKSTALVAKWVEGGIPDSGIADRPLSTDATPGGTKSVRERLATKTLTAII